eukprot:CAMPEP_0177265300 /NCGR_PEP_ID=MMETSP0367-20130122/62038_1 /TAXON_ID=447022 ORGANISM="Scrippsiella hangoei-like, Strain SHHI-4" /NCGR_SAMPLE_ID=MMETSP0367 /ASSEMBLY_ACC=CAM_ASM_000362 /LENGTH=134 /DNA_ID=CAMNT_0018720515 /DNA_START=258 /DNA_END=663 /DNA_ORIENTATION=-
MDTNSCEQASMPSTQCASNFVQHPRVHRHRARDTPSMPSALLDLAGVGATRIIASTGASVNPTADESDNRGGAATHREGMIGFRNGQLDAETVSSSDPGKHLGNVAEQPSGVHGVDRQVVEHVLLKAIVANVVT